MSDSGKTSAQRLNDRRDDEILALSCIFEGQLEDEGKPFKGEKIYYSDSDSDGSPARCQRPSTPVRRYTVKLPEGVDEKLQPGPPCSMVLEVTYGRLYPLETPGLYIKSIEGLSGSVAFEIQEAMEAVLRSVGGRECVYEVCMAASKVLKDHQKLIEAPQGSSLWDGYQKRVREEQERKKEEEASRKVAEEEAHSQQCRVREEAERMEKEQQRERINLVLQYQSKLEKRKKAETSKKPLDFLRFDSGDEGSPSSANRSSPASCSASVSPVCKSVGPAQLTLTRGRSEPTQTSKSHGGRMPSPEDFELPPCQHSHRRNEPSQNSHSQNEFDMHFEEFSERFRGSKSTSKLGLYYEVSRSGTPSSSDFESGAEAECVVFFSENATVQGKKRCNANHNDEGAASSACDNKMPRASPRNHKCGPPSPSSSPLLSFCQPGRLSKDKFASGAAKSGGHGGSKSNAGQSCSEGILDDIVVPSSSRYENDFEEIRVLGRGGFGLVTKVRHRVDRQYYAVKKIELSGKQDEVSKILQECSMLPRLTHLHIVRYYQAWIEAEAQSTSKQPAEICSGLRGHGQEPALSRRLVGTVNNPAYTDWLSSGNESSNPGGPVVGETAYLFIQMEFYDGTTLREAIDSGGLRNEHQLVWRLFRQILEALQYLHSKALIHRDLKPGNVFLSSLNDKTEVHAKLGDFGLSTYAVERFDEGPAIQRDQIEGLSTDIGTALYIAPEVSFSYSKQLGPQAVPGTYDQKADMFSLGVTFFEMWHKPFGTIMERVDVLGNLAKKLGTWLDETPPEAHKVLEGLLVNDPGKRYAAEELLRSELLPASAFDPEDPNVQRLLSSLQNPCSVESMKMIEALFSRNEEPAKDVPYFQQYLTGTAQLLDAQFKDAIFQTLQSLFRKHGALYTDVPLLQPASCKDDKSAQLVVDGGNTLLQFRTNLTQPLARTAPHGWTSAKESTRRRFHLGPVYREPPPSELSAVQFGHPCEISSGVVEFCWRIPANGDEEVKAAFEAHLLHLVLELFATVGATHIPRLELRITHSRLLPLLLEVEFPGIDPKKVMPLVRDYYSSLSRNDAAQQNSSGKSRGRNSDNRDLNKLRSQMEKLLGPRAKAVHIAVDVDGNQTGKQELDRAVEAVVRIAEADRSGAERFVAHLEFQRTQAPQCLQEIQNLPCYYRFLREAAAMLQKSSEHSCGDHRQDGPLHVALDPFQALDTSLYGPGLQFQVTSPATSAGGPLIFCSGGRVDDLIQRLGEHHVAGGSAATRGVSAEFAIDKLCQWLKQQTLPVTKAEKRHRGYSSDTPGPWWRPAGVQAFVYALGNEDAPPLPECLALLGSLWRLGVHCELRPSQALKAGSESGQGGPGLQFEVRIKIRSGTAARFFVRPLGDSRKDLAARELEDQEKVVDFFRQVLKKQRVVPTGNPSPSPVLHALKPSFDINSASPR